MTNKQRLLNAIAGKPVDRIPWGPFLIYWWEMQPPQIRNMSEIGIYREIGADPLIRAHYPTQTDASPYRDLFMSDIRYRHCEVTETVQQNVKFRRYETRVGTLECKYMIDPASQTWFLVEYPLKQPEDYKILQFIMENAQLEPNFKGYASIVKQYGDEILLMSSLVPGLKTAFQQMIERWVGTVNMAYMLEDEPELVEETMQSIRELSARSAKICCESDAEVFITWEDSSTTNYSPSMYEAYALPEINAWGDMLHAQGKYLVQHACGHIHHLLPIIAKSNIDCLESITPLPTGNITMAEAAAVLPERISIVGGIEPTILLSSDMETLEKYVVELLDTMKGRSYILSNSDSCPPGVEIEKFKMISELARNYR